MLIFVDRMFAWLLLFGAALNVYGALMIYLPGTEIQVWALAASLAAALIGVLNLLRTTRPADYPLACITLASSLAWIGVAAALGAAMGHMLDPRVLWHAISALALAAFSLRTLVTGLRAPNVAALN